jgi:hypothetical protein
MTGEAHWIDPLLMILGGGGVVFMIWLESRATLFRRRRRQTICPHTGTAVECTCVQDTLTRKWVDVERCSNAIPEDRVSCAKTCLEAANRKPLLGRH